MSRNKKPIYALLSILLGLMLMLAEDRSITVIASDNTQGSKEYLESLNAGVAKILNPSMELGAEKDVKDTSGSVTEANDAIEASTEGITIEEGKELALKEGNLNADTLRRDNAAGDAASKAETPKASSNLVMADVQNALNVRMEADEESEKVGLLYKDCGGKILERKEGWTKLQSGDLVGWAKDEYLFFDEEAEKMAEEVGNLIVTIETDALRVRKEPSVDAGVYVLMAQDDELEVIEVINDEWISVAYDDEIGYVSSEFVDLDFHIDEGETMSAIQAREKAEAEAKAKRTANQGAVVVGADDTRLLAALIYCEAGNQGYEGHLGVGAVVMNRVRSGAYPNSITGVIYASGQFPPALNGKVARVYEGNIPEGCIKAAQDAIDGATNVGTATHFKRAGARDGIVIGDHVFW